MCLYCSSKGGPQMCNYINSQSPLPQIQIITRKIYYTRLIVTLKSPPQASLALRLK